MKNTEASRLAELATAVRQSTMKRLRAVSSGHENWRPTQDSLSFADVAQHLIDADEWLFAKLTSPQVASMKAVAGSVVIETRSQYDWLLDRLGQLGTERAQLLATLSEAELERSIPDDRFGGTATV